MIEKRVIGPVEYLAPDKELKSALELTGIKAPSSGCTIHVFLEQVKGENLDELLNTANYAGRIKVPDDLTEQGAARIDITEALRRAEAVRPNFHISLLTEHEDDAGGQPLQFESLNILHDAPINKELDISADVMLGLRPDRHEA